MSAGAEPGRAASRDLSSSSRSATTIHRAGDPPASSTRSAARSSATSSADRSSGADTAMVRRATAKGYHAVFSVMVDAGVDSRVSRVKQPSLPPPASTRTRTRVAPEVSRAGDGAIVTVMGMIDELFPGFGELADARVVVIDLAGVTFMTSFGVRQWLRSMAAIPATVEHLYLLHCPTIIVDQLNMILNFGGRATIVSLDAPFICSKCSATSKEVVDVLAEGDAIQRGELAPRSCKRCNGALLFDDYVESYFACLKKYRAIEVEPSATALIASAKTLRRTAVKSAPRAASASATVASATVASAAAGSSPGTPRSRIFSIIVIAVLLIAAAVGVYLLVGPS